MSADDRLEEFRRHIGEFKSKFSILLLGPGKPARVKRKYRDEVKQELALEYTVDMMEDHRINIPLDDKFLLILTGKNLVAAIFAKGGSREGACWELGFLEGFARGKDAATGTVDDFQNLQRSVVAWVQYGLEEEITRMVIDGIFTKIEVRPFGNAKNLMDDMKLVCQRKLFASYLEQLWP